MTPCPGCGHPLHGLGTKCWQPGCEWVKESGDDFNGSDPVKADDTRTEKEIEAGIIAALQLLGWTVYKTSQPQKPVGMSPGIPDLYVVGYGVSAWLEVKRPKGRQSEAQTEFQRVVTENGGTYLIVRSEEEAVTWANEARQGRAA